MPGKTTVRTVQQQGGTRGDVRPERGSTSARGARTATDFAAGEPPRVRASSSLADERASRKPAYRMSEQAKSVEDGDPISDATRAEIAQLVDVLKAVKAGDFSVRFEYEKRGHLTRAGELLNDIIGLNEHTASELVRVGRVVGQEGRMHERASVGPAKGRWSDAMSALNQLIADLVAPTNEVARVITAVARGDLSQKMVLEIEGRPVRGEFLRIGTTVNAMVDQLNSFAAEVTRVAKEVGNEGKLGGQAEVKGVSGT
ncbi:MAG TPA: HAMP domain-containing protein, partial [Polyangiaceae bacterium]|nr:HAMP domain-containing protein [Polyangiaceae bacterium]